ncbi:SPW repeat protein [Larkinella sp. VNQ87]|uniref:SPW repeat protein n=1 Tax=Larkinella sp. VNQ87 TaxID=3400921 RepID=UPI003C0031BB
MNIISTKVHGVIDYVAGSFFVISPWIFGFADRDAAQWVPIILGVMAIIYSIFTDYELGLIRRLPMPMHLTMDVLSGIVMVASPWLFDFANRVYLPHVIFGAFEIGAGLLTQRKPYVNKSTTPFHE